MQRQFNRRQFLTAASAAALSTPFLIHAAQTGAKRFGPNDRINVAVIGPGGSRGGYKQGLSDTKAAANHDAALYR